MWHIRFGTNDDWAYHIDRLVDHTRFDCKFGSLDSEDFTEFDCIVPMDLPDYKETEKNKAFEGIKFWTPTADVIELCHDKLALNRLLIGGSFADLVPPLYDSDTSRRFPYILKRRRDAWGVNSYVITNSEEERAVAPLLRLPQYFCQTYITGAVEFALHVLMVHDKVVYAQTVKYEMARSVYVKGKNCEPLRLMFLPQSDHIALYARLLVELGYTGTCCINYKMDNGVPKLLEINPRFGGSLVGDIDRYLGAYLGSLGCT